VLTLLPLLALPLAAAAAPATALLPIDAPPGEFAVLLDEAVAAPFDELRFNLLLEDAVGMAPPDTRVVRVYGRAPGGLVDLESLVPLYPAPDKGEGHAGSGPPVDAPGSTAGWLSGRAVYLSQCHGFIYFDSLDRFSTQRGNLFDTVEDFHNPEGANQFLTRYLENAGAAVYTARERDMTDAMGIADNDGAGYSESGAGFANGPAGFADAAPWANGEDPFNEGTTRTFPATGGATATWTPAVPDDGVWAVYVTWDSAPGNATDAHYRLTHPGGVIDRSFDQTTHGSTWQYVETLWLPAGVGGLTVELIGDSAGGTLSADAVRVGGGMGDVSRRGDFSGRPRWEEGANEYVQWNGAPTSVYDPGGSGNGTDVTARSRWAAWEHPAAEDAVYLSWHSNAGGGTGTVTLTYDGNSGSATAGSTTFAQTLQDDLVDTIRALWDSGWSDRGTYGGGFGELNPVANPEMPAALVELGFHDHPDDTALLKEPRFRRDASRAMYQAVVRYFAERDGVAAAYLPEPPEAFAVLHDSQGRLEASWAAGPNGFPYGDAATGYRLFTSSDGRSWDNGVDVSGTSALVDVPPGQLVFVRVAATNAGGISFPTETLGARRAVSGAPPVLIVDAYDRLQASQLPWEDLGGSLGNLRRMVLPRMNGYDTTVRHADAVDSVGWPFDSATDDAVATFGDWDLVVWAAGEESTTDESFSDSQQTALAAYVSAGGALWVSGSEILWDLDAQGSASDLAFATDVLGATMDADDSGTTVASGVGLLAGLDLSFAFDDAAFDVDYPDVPASSRTVIAEYAGPNPAAVLGNSVAFFGFPFEAIGDEAARFEVAARLLPALVPGYPPAGDDDDAADDDETTTQPTTTTQQTTTTQPTTTTT